MSKYLYSICVKTLGKLFSSAARTEILRVLARQPAPIGLRHLARLAGVHPHSAEVALKSLLDDKLVKRKQATGRPVYALDATRPDAALLRAVFDAAEREQTRIRNQTLQDRARSILPFINEATRMLDRARGVKHET